MWDENVSSKIRIKDKLDNMLYWTYNILSNILFLCSKDKNIVQKNSKFKDIHLGQKCFILGTGPSLKKVNINLLKNKIIFAVNYFYKSDIINLLKPQYYCLYDEKFHTTNKEDTIEALKSLPNTVFFLRTQAYKFISTLDLDTSNVYFQKCNFYQYNDLVRFNMTKNMTGPFNVILACLQIAIYMGFKEIYLLGCDFNSFASLKVEHCYGEPTNRIISMGYELKYYSMISYHHYAIEKHARSNGISIYNLTPNSLLDAYERKDFESLTL